MFTSLHVSHVPCHLSRVKCHVSHVTCCVSHVTIYIYLFFKVVKLVGGGSVINRAYPIQFYRLLKNPCNIFKVNCNQHRTFHSDITMVSFIASRIIRKMTEREVQLYSQKFYICTVKITRGFRGKSNLIPRWKARAKTEGFLKGKGVFYCTS